MSIRAGETRPCRPQARSFSSRLECGWITSAVSFLSVDGFICNHRCDVSRIMYQRDVPAIHPADAAPIAPEQGANPAFCLPAELRCTAPEYAVDSSLQMEFSPHSYLAFRGDFLDDKKGQRTGYATRYSEGTLSWNHWFGATVQLRPELRFDRAWDSHAYDSGRQHNQLIAASDLIFHF
jgi:Putative beta-barrel porin-2, OmpL-like. bbp2